MKNALIVIWLGLIGSIGLFSCGQKKSTANPANAPVPVNLYVVQSQPVEYYDEFPGTTTALSQVDIRAEVEGYVEGIYFKEGDHVQKGQKLYAIDSRIYQASYNQAAANVKVAQGNLDQAQKDADRYIYLNKYDAIAKQVLDHALISLQNAKNQVTSARQDLAKAQTNLNYSIIVAPFDGTIGFSQVRLGTTVSIGTTVLNTISSDNPMGVDFVINEKQLDKFIQIQKQPDNPADSLFTIKLPSSRMYPYSGKISVIDRGVDPQTGTVRIRVVFPNAENELRAGMSVTLRVHNQEKKPQMLVPYKAVVELMGEYFVFAVKDTLISSADSSKKERKEAEKTGAQPRAFQKKITIGQVIGPNIIIKEGIAEGDTIVTDGVQKLHDGSLINASNKPPGAVPGNTTGNPGK